MATIIEDISTTKKRIRLEIPADALDQEIKEALEKARRESRIPGFRPGKTPISLIEKKFGKKIEAEVLEKVLPRAYAAALKETNLMPIDNPVIEGGLDFKRNQPLSVALTVEILPEIANLNYDKLTVKDLPVAVGDEEIIGVLERLQEERSTLEPSENPISIGDIAVLDYTYDESNEDAVKDYIFKVGDNSFFHDDFSGALIGKTKGDKFSLATTFSGANVNKKLAGKKVKLKDILITDVKRKVSPVIDEDFAKDLKFEGLEVMKTNIKNSILKAKETEVAKIQKAELLKKLIGSCEFDVPESLVEKEIETLAAQASIIASSSASRVGEEKDDAAFTQDLRPDALRKVKATLLIDAIGKKEKVTVEEDDVKRAILAMSRNFSMSPEHILKFYMSKEGSIDRLRNSLFEDKVLDLILSKAVKEKGE